MLSYTSLLHPTTQSAIHAALSECILTGARGIGAEMASGAMIVVFKRPLGGFEYVYKGEKGSYNVTEQVKRALKMQNTVPPLIQPEAEHIELKASTRAVFEPLAEYRPQYWGKETQKASPFEWDSVEYCR